MSRGVDSSSDPRRQPPSSWSPDSDDLDAEYSAVRYGNTDILNKEALLDRVYERRRQREGNPPVIEEGMERQARANLLKRDDDTD